MLFGAVAPTPASAYYYRNHHYSYYNNHHYYKYYNNHHYYNHRSYYHNRYRYW